MTSANATYVRSFADLACALFSVTGCFKQTFTNEAFVPTGEEDSSHKVFGVFGLVGDATVDTRAACKEGVHSIVWEADALDVFVTTITLGLVGLRSVDVECGRPATAAGQR